MEHSHQDRGNNCQSEPDRNGGDAVRPVFRDSMRRVTVYHGYSIMLLRSLPHECADLIFADPPYFLSNDGITCRAGRMVSVNKGDWDRSHGIEENHEFNKEWLAACQRLLKPNGTIWVSGTSHVIHSVGFAMQQLGFKFLNDITWVKPNPPPNLSCRYFTHATETIIWAAKNRCSRHRFHYEEMKRLAGGKQMKSVWQIPAASAGEKRLGRYPTQKPVGLLERILLASSSPGDTVLDPFMGSGTTLVAARRLMREAVGIDLEADAVTLSLIRIYSEEVHVALDVSTTRMNLDLSGRVVDRSIIGNARVPRMAERSQLVRRERKFYFVGSERREVVYSVLAEDLEEAWKRFRASRLSSTQILFVIKTETEIYLTMNR